MPRTVRPGALCALFGVLFALPAASVQAAPGQRAVPALIEEYIAAWKAFYPSAALSEGFLDAIGGLEDFSSEAITAWIEVNRMSLAALEQARAASDSLTEGGRIDARLLRARIREELDLWENDRPHERSLALYAERIDGALEPVLESPNLSREEREGLLLARLEGIVELAGAAKENLRDGSPEPIRQALESLRAFSPALPAVPGLERAGAAAVEAVGDLARFVEDDLIARLTLPDEPVLGRERYATKLTIYTDSDLTPERLEVLAWQEIQASRTALAEMADAYWRATYPEEPLPDDPAALIARAFADLEANRPVTERQYLLDLRRYRDEVRAFVRDHEIATVPDNDTLSIELAPESSGPMARIGFVSSAPPFHPNPWTTWFLATIPDSHPERERVEFWRSFSYSYKRFIVIHELYPGHYMQLKILRENPHPLRVLFPYRPFIEGWATFTERIVLDAGYAAGDWLTRLAQLRKRLENANRAYMSVQAHCNGWSEERVFDFSIQTSLLAPQFAKSLWGRLMRSPMQILTYMLMGLELQELYDSEVERLDDRFVLREFMDTILRTGPVPSEELSRALLAETP